MPTDALIVIGAGGHGRVVFDAALALGRWATIEIRDDVGDATGTFFGGRAVTPPALPKEVRNQAQVHVAIGRNDVRRSFAERMRSVGAEWATIIHPAAIVSSLAVMDAGVFVAARAIIAPHARLESGCIVNHGAIIDHDCRVGAWTHVAPGVIIGGGVIVGSGTLLGAGSIVLPGVSVGDGVIVGAGAVVTKNVPAGATIVGVPARPIDFRSE